jgi:ribosomal protein L21
MKSTIKLVLLVVITLSVFTSCKSYRVMHYEPKELDKVGSDLSIYHVYLHDQHKTYRVENPSISQAGIKGTLDTITDPAKLTAIRNPETKKQLKKHKDDLNFYTKIEIQNVPNQIALKKENISNFTKEIVDGSGFDAGLYAQIILVVALGTVVWIGIASSFHGLL